MTQSVLLREDADAVVAGGDRLRFRQRDETNLPRPKAPRGRRRECERLEHLVEAVRPRSRKVVEP